MNNTIDFNTAKTIGTMSKKIRQLKISFQVV